MDPDVHHGLADKIGGLALLLRWTGSEKMMRTKFWVPVLIVAYNLFMNAVDQLDQKRAACAILRKEIRVSQSIFTWILDAACINANALRMTLLPGDEIKLPEFKRRVSLYLVSVYVQMTGGNQWNKRPRTNELTRMLCRETHLAPAPATQQTTIRCHHVLIENKPNKRQVYQGCCILCRLLKKRCETKCGCTDASSITM